MENEVCDFCDSTETEYRVDPFLKEVHEEIVWYWLCEECYQQRNDDI